MGKYDSVHDIVLSTFGKSLTEEQLENLVKRAPKDIVALGEKWGFNDTVFRDEFYNWFIRVTHIF